MLTALSLREDRRCSNCDGGGCGEVVTTVLFSCSVLWKIDLVQVLAHTEWPKKMYTLLQQFGSFDSVWMPMAATSNTYIESKIQGHLSYQFCFCINTVVTIIE